MRGTDLELLSNLPSIEELSIEGTLVTDISYLTTLKNLKVLYAPTLSPGQFQVLAQLPQLVSLTCSPGKNTFNLGEKPGKKTKEELDFMQQCLLALSNSKTIRHLRLVRSRNTIHYTSDSFAPLGKFSRLTYLELAADDNLNDSHLVSVGKCSQLETLVLGYSEFSSKGIESLAPCKSLKSLTMCRVNDNILSAVAQLPTLSEAWFSYSSLSRGRVSDTMLVRLKKDRPQLHLAERGDAISHWSQYVPLKKLQLLK